MPRQGLVTTDGRRVEVLSPGFHNKDAGPDFFCADIVIDGEDWMGNVEIHTFSSDWYRHGHDHDKTYNNVAIDLGNHILTQTHILGQERNCYDFQRLTLTARYSFNAMGKTRYKGKGAGKSFIERM